MRIMAVDTAHRAFRQPVVVRLLEGSPDVLVAAGALSIDFHRLAGHQSIRSVGMDLMAGDARDGIIAVAALEASDMRGLIEMTFETGLVGGRRGQFSGIMNQRRVARTGVQRPHSVAALAAMPFVAPLGRDLDHVVRALNEGIEDIFVARLAGFRADEIRLLRCGGSRRRSLGGCRWRSL